MYRHLLCIYIKYINARNTGFTKQYLDFLLSLKNEFTYTIKYLF